MSKKLPYFQFEPAQYLAGNIQFCSLEAQGLFINICSLYWQRDCELTQDQLTRKFNNSKAIKELVDEEIIHFNSNKYLIIDFLKEQYEDILKSKKRLSDAGKKGAQIKKNKATLKPPLSPASTTLKQPDNIIEDNIIEKKEESFIMIQSILEEKETLNALMNVLNINKLKLTNYFNEFSIQYLTDKFTPEEYKDKLTHFINYVKKQEKDEQKENEPERGINGKYLGQAPTPLN
jgi:hypothetical protein